jgi:PKD repeat protein
MKKHLYILTLILFSLIAFQSKASHFTGCDISYQCTSTPGVYKVSLKLYRDCSGINFCSGCANTPGTTAGCTVGNQNKIIGASPNCIGTNFGTFTLNAVVGNNGYDIIQTCSSIRTICTNCNTRTAGTYTPGMEVYLFEGNVNLNGIPASCCNITLSYSDCCRNAALTTMVPDQFYTQATINRCQTPCNSAPTFTNDAVVLVCAGEDFIYNLGANDPDGDSLSYAFGESFQGAGSAVQYVAPYSANYPFNYFGAPNMNATSPAGLHIDPKTGDVQFRPMGIFVSYLVIEVTQWKSIGGIWTNVGMTRRDVQIQTRFCANNLPPIVKVNGSTNTLNFLVFAGQQICLDIVAQDRESLTSSPPILADTTDLTWNNPGLYTPTMSNATFTRNYILSERGIYGPKADSFKFCWTPPINAVRTSPYLFTFSGADKSCPLRSVVTRGIAITVVKPKSINIDSTTKNTFCNNRITTTNINYNTSSINLVSGNVLTVQLSDSSGSFTNATNIGTKTTTDTFGFISVTFPSGLFTNSQYKIRINASSDTINLGTPYAVNFVTGFNAPIITSNKDSLCKGLVSTFKVTPNTTGLTFKWLKNNVIIANQTKDSLLVDSAYNYRAIVSNTGCSDTSNMKYLTVHPLPKAGFTINNPSQCIKGNNFIFTDTSKIATGTLSRKWNFGAGALDTSTILSPTKIYVTDNSYIVKLVAISNNGCKDSVSKSIFVDEAPKVGFNINNAEQCINGNSFSFTNTTYTINLPGLFSSTWYFGEGQNDVSYNFSPTKVFTTPNTYSVKLVAEKYNGCNDSIIKTITVHPKPTVNFMVNNPSQCSKSNNFIFADSTSIQTGTFTRKWNFGTNISDTSNNTNPTKTYNTPNTYSVKLIATSNNNCKDSMVKNITVNSNSTANFNINTIQQCLMGNNFVFTNTSTNSNAQTWSFGDASNSNVLSPTKTYVNAGSYNVKLVAKNNANCPDSITKTVTIYPQPSAAFSINNPSQCLNGNNFLFTDNSSITSGTINRLWLFSNGDTSTNASVNKSYFALGTFGVKLTVKSDKNCLDTISKTVTVTPNLIIGNILGNTNPTSTINPYSYSVLNQANVTYSWTATNGTIQTGQGTNAISVVWANAGV